MSLRLVIAICWAASLATTAWWAYGAGQDHEVAARSREDRAAGAAAQIAATAAADAISKIEVKHVTVRQELEREIRTREVFRDCRSGPGPVGLFNAAIPGAGPASAADPFQLPAADPAR